jgi:uncharacterized protein
MATAVAADGAPSAGTHPSVPASAHLAALGWLLLSSPLVVVPPGAAAQLASFTDGESAAITRWLHSLQADSQALVAWMQAKPEVRIGRYAERLLEFYLSHAPSSSASPVAAHAPSHLSPHLSPHSSPQQSLHSLVAAHVPLRSEVNGLRVTQGELDFLLTNAQGQHLHWELAVKFFLCTATGDVATPADFIGPNGVETLAHKWHKLFARQLTHTPPAPWNARTWQPQAFTRGWMFYRWGMPVPQCDALHPQHGQGWWIDVTHMSDLPDAMYAYLPRLHWMAPLASVEQLGSQAVVLARDAMAAHLHSLWASGARSADAHMVVQLGEIGFSLDGACEVQRFFVRPQG